MKQVITKKQKKSSRKKSDNHILRRVLVLRTRTRRSARGVHNTYQDPLYNAYSKLLEEKSNAT